MSTTPADTPSVRSPCPPARMLDIAGSLRQGSYNHALLRAAQAEAPSGVQMEIYTIAPIPFYNAKVEAQGDPNRWPSCSRRRSARPTHC